MELLELVPKAEAGDVDACARSTAVGPALMEAEVSAMIGAEYGEWMLERVTHRTAIGSGSGDICAGTIELAQGKQAAPGDPHRISRHRVRALPAGPLAVVYAWSHEDPGLAGPVNAGVILVMAALAVLCSPTTR
jgi:hypothetical protein